MAGAFEPFVVRIDEDGDGYEVTAEFRGASQSAALPRELPPLAPGELDEARRRLDEGGADDEFTRDFGDRLFRAVFAGEVGAALSAARARVAPGGGLRVVLVLPSSLQTVPWELMYDAAGEHGFLARSGSVSLARFFPGLPIPNDLPTAGPLRVLVAAASPRDFPALSEGLEAEAIAGMVTGRRRVPGVMLQPRAALRDLRGLLRGPSGSAQTVALEVDVLDHATRAALARRVLDARAAGRPFHVIHFAGHGVADETGAYLVLEQPRGEGAEAGAGGEPDFVSAADFAELIAGPQLGLVVLNACQTAVPAGLFEGAAQAILGRGVPAVVAMQTEVLDQSALAFAREFYYAWAAGEPLEAALAHARRLLTAGGRYAASAWAVPVLFAGPPSTLSLRMTFPPRVSRWQAWPLRGVRRAAAIILGLLSTLTLLVGVTDLDRRLRTEAPLIRCLVPYPMEENKFNVAMVPFTHLDAGGRVVRDRLGADLAGDLHRLLDDNLDELDLGTALELRPPAHGCALPGATPAARERAARDLAHKIRARVVIYGAINEGEDGADFVPEFYVDYPGFEEASEITGPYELGEAVPVEPDFEVLGDHPLVPRVRALSLITVGLLYYSTDDYERALGYFDRAAQTDRWLDYEGKEIVYLLLGNAHARKASAEKTVEQAAIALDYYEQSLAVDPGFARAHVGKAGALYLLAQGDLARPLLNQVDTGLLQMSADTFEQAAAMPAPESANIEVKARFGLAQVYLVRYYLGEAGLGPDPDAELRQATAALEAVVQAHRDGRPGAQNLAGQALAHLGLLAREGGRPDEAIEDYRQAADLVTPHWQAEYLITVGDIYAELGDTGEARRAYERARGVARRHADEALILKSEEKLAALN